MNTAPTRTLARARLAVAGTHLDAIAEITDDLRRLEPSGEPLRELVARLELHTAAAREEIDVVSVSPLVRLRAVQPPGRGRP
jgi:hypothetical protein